MVMPVSSSNIDNISPQEVKDRLKLLNKDTPLVYLTSLVKEPQEITLRTVARNNIMLDNVLANQQIIMQKQDEILSKLGNNLDVEA